MPYLIYRDFKLLCQSDNLLQVVGNDLSLLSGIELVAQTEAISYLIQKYITSIEFSDTLAYNPALTYKSGQRVFLDANPYSINATYLLGELTLQAGSVFVSNVAITVPEAFTQSKWIYLGTQYEIFYVGYPYPKFDLYGNYKRGDLVWWSDRVYTNLQPTIIYGHDGKLQSGSNQTIYNIFPDDTSNGLAAWGAGTAYSVPPGTLYSDPVNNFTPAYSQTLSYQYTATGAVETVITIPALIGMSIIQIEKEIKPLFTSAFSFDTSSGTIRLIGNDLSLGQSLFILYSTLIYNVGSGVWIKGDNRNPQLVMYCCDIALYHIHSRIAPRNIPDLRVKRYDEAIKWLKMAGRGEITPALPVIQPLQGNRIRYASQIKQVNDY